ncbi:hypothetical protein TrLO_g3599 [Triparma laevis f. longispina]|uniref:O-GlcNAc transferase C-terminal domain-containing protein n=1 Tax=Triparma laevis f. longispina TaxID=1714387 RepID=A0A9W7AW52_9STRA|nr:hypothetical protein TrLO_g3599 [Triparma laevis f. longispina]
MRPSLLLITLLPFSATCQESNPTDSSSELKTANTLCFPASVPSSPDSLLPNIISASPHYLQSLALADTWEEQTEVVRSFASCISRVCSAHEESFSAPSCSQIQSHLITSPPTSPPLPPLLLSSLYNDLGTSIPSPLPTYRSTFLKAAHLTSPSEPAIIKNLGFLLEQTGRIKEAEEMYNSHLSKYELDAGINFLEKTLCPPHQNSSIQAKDIYLKIVSGLLILLSQPPPRNLQLDPTREIGQMPLGFPYLGIPLRPLLTLFSRAYIKHFPILTQGSIVPYDKLNSDGTIELGIIAEYSGNTSPGKLLQSTIIGLHKTGKFDVTIFLPQIFKTDFVEAIVEEGIKIVHLDIHNLESSKLIIKNQHKDILLYMAIGMSPLTYYLSFTKLSRIQVQFGHGHPITSGNPTIDYFVTSEFFREEGGGRVRMEGGMEDEELGEVAKEMGEFMGVAGEEVFEYGGDAYVEQVVYFQTLTASIPPPSLPNLPLPPPLSPHLHYYALLQYSKKIHPMLDDAILGIVRGDDEGRVLMLEGSRVHVSRWRESGWSEDEISRILFVGRMPHTDFLNLISHCSCALGTFPWGEGVTTFEAFAVNIPTVILPGKVTVENLSLGQVRVLGVESELKANDIPDYVSKVIRLGKDKEFRRSVKAKILDNIHKLWEVDEIVEEWMTFFTSI